MAKVFFSYQQQIEKLVKEKDLLIADEEYAKEMLKRYSYYSLISGYKDIFKNTTTKTYKKEGCYYRRRVWQNYGLG